MGEELTATRVELGQLVCPESCWSRQLQGLYVHRLLDHAEEKVCLKGLQTGVCCSVRSSAKSSHVCCDKRSPCWDVQGTCLMLSSMGGVVG